MFKISIDIPGCTETFFPEGSILIILFICLEKSITIAWLTVWPDRLDPPPLGIIGILYSAAIWIIVFTSLVVLGIATQIGSIRYIEASVEYISLVISSKRTSPSISVFRRFFTGASISLI